MSKPSLYPSTIPWVPGHPNPADFQVRETEDKGKALTCLTLFHRGEKMARFDGWTSPVVMQHTLQKREGVHIYDPHFIGMLAHSCDPNVMLDMDTQEMWALKEIRPGDVLSMDYAATEDHLFKSFPCSCGSKNCRGFITGRKQMVPFSQHGGGSTLHPIAEAC